MSYETFMIQAFPNAGQSTPNGWGTVFSKNYIDILNKYNYEDAYYWYLDQKIYIGRQGATWLDDNLNWPSINKYKWLIIFFVKKTPSEADFQFNYISSYYPDDYFLYLPYNFYTNGLIFASNCGEHLGGNNQPIQVFSNGRNILSFITMSIDPQAYSNPQPIDLYNTVSAITYPGQLSDSNLPYTPLGTISNFNLVNKSNFDQLIIFTYNQISMGNLQVTQTAYPNPNYTSNIDWFFPPSSKLFLVNLARNFGYYATGLRSIAWTNPTCQISSIFSARAPLCGNKSLGNSFSNYNYNAVFYNNIPFGTVSNTGVITPGGTTSKYLIVKSPDFDSNPSGSYYGTFQYTFSRIAANPNRVVYFNYSSGSPIPVNTIYTGVLVVLSNYSILIWDDTVANFKTGWSYIDVPDLNTWSYLSYINFPTDNNYQFSNEQYGNFSESNNVLTYPEDGCTLFSNDNFATTRWCNYQNTYYVTNAGVSQALQTRVQTTVQNSENQNILLRIRANAGGFATVKQVGFDNKPFSTGMYIDSKYINYKMYFKMRHFVYTMINLPIDVSAYTTYLQPDGSTLYKYNAFFSIPDIFPSFRFVSLHMDPDIGGIWTNPQSTISIVLYSNMTKQIRSYMQPLFIKNVDNTTQNFGEITNTDVNYVYSNTLIAAQNGSNNRNVYFMFC